MSPVCTDLHFHRHFSQQVDCIFIIKGINLACEQHTCTVWSLSGECGAIRQSSTVLHRQFSLPTPAPPAMYTLRPRIQQQQQTSFSGSSLPRPATSIQNQQPGVLGFNSSRHVRTRRQVFRPHAAPVGFTTDPSSVMQSHSSSPVQQFPSPTS